MKQGIVTAPTGEMFAVQYMRGVAAAIVVIFHAFEFYNADFHLHSSRRIVLLASGVDMFFVISGTIIIVSTRRSNLPIGDFVVKRLIRIVPIYWIATLSWIAMPLLLPGVIEPVAIDPDALVRSLLLVPRSDGDLFPTTLPVGWSLCYELYFYAIVAASLRIGQLVPRTMAIMGFVTGAVLLRATGIVSPNAYFASITLEFVAGCGLALFVTGAGRPAPAGASVVAVAAAVCWLGTIGLLPVDRFVAWGIPAAAIVFGAVNLDRIGRVPPVASLRLLGDASYSIYLWHLPVFVVTAAIVRPFTGSEAVLLAARVAASLGAGVLLYVWLERPLTRRLRRRSHLPRTVTDQATAEPLRPIATRVRETTW